MKKISLIVTLVILSDCLCGQSNKVYLAKVLDNLNQIKSAAYFSETSASAPQDTSKLNTFHRYYKEYNNPTDEFIGSAFAWFKPMDTTKMEFFYDGKAKGYLDWIEKTIRIDSFRNNTLPFRPIGPPFFNYTRSIIKYALETTDSISIDLRDFGDSILFTLNIYNEIVEFFGNDHWYTDREGLIIESQDIISRYDLWIKKSDNLPFRIRRKMPHNTSFETCKNVKLNKGHQGDLSASKYFPSDFSITSSASARNRQKIALNGLVGKEAPDWSLKDVNNNTIEFKALKSKVLMIQFTGVGCGPCHLSIPFLKQLVNDYRSKDFELIAIETWSKNIEGLKRYQDRNGLNFKFLKSVQNVVQSYQVMAVPVFFIIDENRLIKKVISGYKKEVTDKEIENVINGLLN